MSEAPSGEPVALGAAIRAERLAKRYRVYHDKSRTMKEAIFRGRGDYEEFWALREVDLEISHGETVGILGANGSGKSTLLKLIARILQPDSGSLTVDGTVSALLEVGAGFHPEYTGRENIYLYGALLGLTRAEVNHLYPAIVEFAGLERFIDNPVKNYSSGMYMRLGFAVAIHVDPDILLIDEVLAVGDAAFQRKCLDRIADLKVAGKTIVFVSHDLGTMAELCHRAIWMDGGGVVVDGPSERAIGMYRQSSEDASQPAPVHGTGGMDRWGSGEVKITGMRTLDATEIEVRHVAHGQPARLQVELEAVRPVAGAAIGIGIFKRDGAYCTGVNTAFDDCQVDFSAGHNSVVLEIPQVDLAPGSYLLDLAAFDAANGHVYDFHSRTSSLTVNGDAAGEGTYIIRHRWHVVGSPKR